MELGVAQMWSFIVSGIRFDRNGVSSPGNGAILVCSDSQVLLRSLRRGPLSQDGYLEGSIWRNILSIVESYPALRAFVFQWIPGKVNYDKMQRAHQLATGALAAFTAQDHSTAPISYKCTRLAITRQVRESWAAAAAGPHRARIFGSGPTQLRQSGEISRRDASLLAQIRVGKHRELGSLFFDLRGLFHTDSRLCRWCTNVAESPVHLLIDCPDPQICQLRSHLPRHVPGVPPMARLDGDGSQEYASFFRALARGPGVGGQAEG